MEDIVADCGYKGSGAIGDEGEAGAAAVAVEEVEGFWICINKFSRVVYNTCL